MHSTIPQDAATQGSQRRFWLPLSSILVAGLCAAPANAQLLWRTIDGTGNNPIHPNWGTTGLPLMRKTPVGYADGHSVPTGASLPSARAVSNLIVASTGPVPNSAQRSDYIWQWGQFIDHDLDLTGSANPAEAFNVLVPKGDPHFDPNGTGTQVIALDRSKWVMDSQLVRQQINQLTAWIDGSGVYGSDDARALELRTLDGTGRLKVSTSAYGDLLPLNVNGFDNAPTSMDPTLFLAGDVRANEQLGLTAMHTLFVREHNSVADFVGALVPSLDDELRYQVARAVVGAEIQRITYDEYLLALLGPNALPAYTGWKPNVEPTIENFFSTASFRYGHSQLSPQLQRLDSNLQPIAAGHLPLKQAFFNQAELFNGEGIEPLLRGLAHQVAQEVDNQIVDDVRNFLFGLPGQGGFDLASLNIQRGRDHGLATYNQARVSYGLPAATSFADVTSDPVKQMQLRRLYGDVNKIDGWVGGLAEDHAAGSLVGPLLKAVLVDQFTRLRDGDRFWHEIAPIPTLFAPFLQNQTLSTIIRRNTTIGNELQANAFQAPPGA